MAVHVTGMQAFGFNEPQSALSRLSANGKQEVRCAVRFPLRMRVSISSDHGELLAMTRNVSASGVLFEMAEALQTGSQIQFTLKMPGEALGLDADVQIKCSGRVTRSVGEDASILTASTIDEYEFV